MGKRPFDKLRTGFLLAHPWGRCGFRSAWADMKLGGFKSEVQHSGINERGLNAVGLTPCGLLSGRATVAIVATDETHYAEFDQNHRC